MPISGEDYMILKNPLGYNPRKKKFVNRYGQEAYDKLSLTKKIKLGI